MNRTDSVNTTGFFRGNPVLSSYLLLTAVIMCGSRAETALAAAFAFSVITFVSVMISSFIPKAVPYAVRLMLHGITAAAVYIPVKLFADSFFPDAAAQTGIFFPLAAFNSIIIFHAETKYFTLSRKKAVVSLLTGILGADAVLILVGIIREAVAFGTVFDRVMDINFTVSGIAKPFGGMILLGLLCGIYRFFVNSADAKSEKSGGEADASE